MNAPSTSVRPRDAQALGELLRARLGRLRLAGSGSRQARLPRAPGALVVDLSGIHTIDRLDAPDQTCSVDCGVTRAQLDAALEPHGLELPCPGDGTLGGLFASDPIGAAVHGGHGPRSLLLGMDALLADGTPFKSGARVVKSVAGFDVHRLLVGSEGRLFLATRLHLRLKPAPRVRVAFANPDLERQAALALLRQLRELAHGLSAVQLLRTAGGGFCVRGAIAGRSNFVRSVLAALALRETDTSYLLQLDPPSTGEVLAGIALPSSLPRLLATLPDAPFLWHGGGRFEAALPDARATDRLLAALPALGMHARIVRGGAERIGSGTPIDAGQRRIADRLKQTLDPDDVLC